MNLTRAFRYAGIQARLRARIGKMPDMREWRALAAVTGGGILDGLEGIGVDFWLEGLSSGVSSDAVERHFNGRSRFLFRRLAAWLPGGWTGFGELLTLAPDIFWIRPILAGEDPGTRLDRDSELHPVLRSAVDQRRKVLEATRFARFIDEARRPEDVWREDLVGAVPRLSRGEARPVKRLVSLLERHVESKKTEFGRIASRSIGVDEGIPEAGTWRLHADLERELRLQLAGDPFQPALILVYGLLELLTMERLRSLILARLLDWKMPPALAGA